MSRCTLLVVMSYSAHEIQGAIDSVNELITPGC